MEEKNLAENLAVGRAGWHQVRQGCTFAVTGHMDSLRRLLGQRLSTKARINRGYSVLVAPRWVAGVHVQGTLSDMIFHAEGTSNLSSTRSSRRTVNRKLQSPQFDFQRRVRCQNALGHRSNSSVEWLVTPSTLLYGTGGVTYAGFGDGFNSDNTFRAWGWSAGGGVEQKFGSNWSVQRFCFILPFLSRMVLAGASAGHPFWRDKGSRMGPQ